MDKDPRKEANILLEEMTTFWDKYESGVLRWVNEELKAKKKHSVL